MKQPVNIVAWAYAADGTCGGVEMVATRDLMDSAMDMLEYSMRESIRIHFRQHDSAPAIGPFYVIVSPNWPFTILKEGTL